MINNYTQQKLYVNCRFRASFDNAVFQNRQLHIVPSVITHFKKETGNSLKVRF